MINKKTALCCMLGAGMVFFTSSKKENRSNTYYDELCALAEQTLVGGGKLEADSLRGKMLILNFWASYDPASRINSFELSRIRDQYSGQTFDGGDGLSVVSISLDVFRSPLVKAIEADGVQDFYHVCDFKGEESPLAKNFDVNRPVNLLVSSNGQIVARDFGTSTLNETLAMLTK